jgi:multidrug efflux pump subunit AcrA (membrane-fusion protein)
MQTTKKKTRVWLWVLIAVVVTIAATLILLNGALRRASEPVYVSHTVENGSVERTITGSGRLTSSDDETLQLPASVRVSSVPAKQGDTVKAGDVLAILDVDSLRDLAAQTSKEVSALDNEIDRRSKVTQIKAPVRGRIKYLPAQEGDDVLAVIGKYGALALISSDEKMSLEIKTTAQLTLYSDVTVRWNDGEGKGMIFEKTIDGYLVTIKDSGVPYLASAQVYDGDTLLGEGTLQIHAPVAVLASGGEITYVRVDLDDYVYANKKLFAVENAPAGASYNEAYAERAEKAALYATLLAYIQDPRVLSPVDGVVNEIKIVKDTNVPDTTASSGMTDAFVVHVGGAVKLSIDADELDIDAVALGQSASVTLDAYPGETFEATVTHISRIGTVDGSITTYPVEVTLSYDERLLEGMNGSAVILTSSVENVPLLPIDLINEDSTGEYVTVKNEAGELVRRDITTGLSDGVNAEITSGLASGDLIWYLMKAETPKIPGMNYGANRAENIQQGTNGNGGE